jgi:DNA-binding CsgD family transcriptional regulator
MIAAHDSEPVMTDRHALAPWGVDERSERLYRAVLRHPQRDADELARILDWEPAEVTEAARPLLRIRLLRVTDDGNYLAPPPNSAIESLVSAEQQRLQQRQEQVHQARTAVPDFTAEHLAGQAERWTPVPVDVVSGAEVVAVIEDLCRTTTGEVCSFVRRSRNPRFPYLLAVGTQIMAAGRRMRTVYPLSALDDDGELEAIRVWVGRGEEARIAPRVPTRMIVFGDEAVLVDASYDRESDTEIVVRAPAIVATFRELFDRLWTQAVTVPKLGSPSESLAMHAGPGYRLTEEERKRTLELLALGGKDEAVARHLGVSLRTVRRRVADLLEELGATTRFQAGMEAVRRGWI